MYTRQRGDPSRVDRIWSTCRWLTRRCVVPEKENESVRHLRFGVMPLAALPLGNACYCANSMAAVAGAQPGADMPGVIPGAASGTDRMVWGQSWTRRESRGSLATAVGLRQQRPATDDDGVCAIGTQHGRGGGRVPGCATTCWPSTWRNGSLRLVTSKGITSCCLSTACHAWKTDRIRIA